MKKEYITPEAEMMKFIADEEIMGEFSSDIAGVVPDPGLGWE